MFNIKKNYTVYQIFISCFVIKLKNFIFNLDGKILNFFTIIFFVYITLCSCNNIKSPPTDYYKIIGYTQGTTYSIIYNGDSTTFSKLEIDSILHDFDMSLSIYKPGSIISRINKNDTGVVIDKYFRIMFDTSLDINKKTDGVFDITIGQITKVLGFGITEANDIVNEQITDSLLQYVGISKVKIDGEKVVKEYPEILLDCNAIAQGQSVDVISEFIESKNVNNYLVEIGGEIKAKGTKFGRVWRVGIDKPIENIEYGKELQVKLELKNKALATSGNYRKFYVRNGKKYTHSINPKTGKPAYQNILSATVIANNCMIADAYATACMVAGLEKAKQFINNDIQLEAYFIYSDKNGKMEVYYTEGIKSMIVE